MHVVHSAAQPPPQRARSQLPLRPVLGLERPQAPPIPGVLLLVRACSTIQDLQWSKGITADASCCTAHRQRMPHQPMQRRQAGSRTAVAALPPLPSMTAAGTASSPSRLNFLPPPMPLPPTAAPELAVMDAKWGTGRGAPLPPAPRLTLPLPPPVPAGRSSGRPAACRVRAVVGPSYCHTPNWGRGPPRSLPASCGGEALSAIAGSRQQFRCYTARVGRLECSGTLARWLEACRQTAQKCSGCSQIATPEAGACTASARARQHMLLPGWPACSLDVAMLPAPPGGHAAPACDLVSRLHSARRRLCITCITVHGRGHGKP